MSDTSPTHTETAESSMADAAEYARAQVEEIEVKAAADEASIEAGDESTSLEEAVGQARPDVEGTPADEPADE